MWVKKEELTEDEKPLDDDPVVQEIKVFLSKELQDKLYLVQYPLRPADRGFEEETILEAKMKPEQDKIQLTFGVNTKSRRYDKKVGAKMKEQQNPQGKKSCDEDYDSDYEEKPEPGMHDEFIMESSGLPDTSKSTRYVLGTIRPEGLFITPFKAIVQMRPSFEHLDKADKNTKLTKKTSKNESSDSSEEEMEEEPTKVTVKFNQKDRNSKTYSALAKIKDEEPWINVKFNKKDEDASQKEFCKLFSGNFRSNSPVYIIDPEEYKNNLLPKHFELDVESPYGEKKKTTQMSKATKMLNVNQIKLLSFSEQLKMIMKNCGVLTYAQIDNYLRRKLGCLCDEKTLLRGIQIVSTLIQGCWVVRSDLVFPTDYKSGAHGISGIVMQKARDTILHQFFENRWVDRKHMCALTHLPTEEVTEILSKIAERKVKPGPEGEVPNHGWEFRLPYDSDFVANYPDVVQRQTLIIQMKISNFKKKKEEQGRTRSSGSESSGPNEKEKETKTEPPKGSAPSDKEKETKYKPPKGKSSGPNDKEKEAKNKPPKSSGPNDKEKETKNKPPKGSGPSDKEKETKYKPPVGMGSDSPPRPQPRRRSSRSKSHTSESESELMVNKDNVFRKPVRQRTTRRNSSTQTTETQIPRVQPESMHLLTPKTEPE